MGCGPRRWWPGLVLGGSLGWLCGGVSWLRSRWLVLVRWSCRAVRWWLRWPRRGGARSLAPRWLRVLAAGVSGGLCARFPALWSSPVSAVLRRRGLLLRLGRVGLAFRSLSGGSPAAVGRSGVFPCRWPCRRRCGSRLPPRSRLRSALCGLSHAAPAAAAVGRPRSGLPVALALARLPPRAGRALPVGGRRGAGVPPRPRVRASARPRRSARVARAAPGRAPARAFSAGRPAVRAAGARGSAGAARRAAAGAAARWAVSVARFCSPRARGFFRPGPAFLAARRQ